MQTGVVSDASPIPSADDPSAWLTLDQLADVTGEDPRKVRQLVREQRLITVRRDDGESVPAAFVAGGRLLKGLGGLTTLLRDAGYSGYASLEPHLSDFTSLGGFSGPAAFGRAGRALRTLTDQIGVTLR